MIGDSCDGGAGARHVRSPSRAPDCQCDVDDANHEYDPECAGLAVQGIGEHARVEFAGNSLRGCIGVVIEFSVVA